MTAQTAERLITAEEFEQIAHQYIRAELIDGRVVELTPTRRGHGKIEARIGAILLAHADRGNLGDIETGEAGCRLPNGRVRAPDVLFVRKERTTSLELSEEGFWPFAPDLAVEVISSSETVTEVRDKANEWIAAGSKLVWTVDSKTRTVMVYELAQAPRVLGEGDTLDGGEVLPGFSCQVSEIFR